MSAHEFQRWIVHSAEVLENAYHLFDALACSWKRERLDNYSRREITVYRARR